LDLGCGRGGYSQKLFGEGAHLTSLDITKEHFQNIKGATFVSGDAVKMPFKDKSFDFVFCSSLIEHIKNPDSLIKEIKRVLTDRGMCYLSFPPFWSPVGAHQFKPFHYLGEKTAIKLSRKYYHVRSYRYDDVYGKLYKRTIRQVKQLIKNNKFKIKAISTRMSPINFAKIPILNEFLTWNVEFLIEK
jgi:ubiquinone/menaquinone biosynthesis C-methylase UbiE